MPLSPHSQLNMHPEPIAIKLTLHQQPNFFKFTTYKPSQDLVFSLNRESLNSLEQNVILTISPMVHTMGYQLQNKTEPGRIQ